MFLPGTTSHLPVQRVYRAGFQYSRSSAVTLYIVSTPLAQTRCNYWGRIFHTRCIRHQGHLLCLRFLISHRLYWLQMIYLFKLDKRTYHTLVSGRILKKKKKKLFLYYLRRDDNPSNPVIWCKYLHGTTTIITRFFKNSKI